MLPLLEPRPPLGARYLGRQPPAEVEVSSLELDPTLQLRVLGSAPPQSQALPQDLEQHLHLVLLQHLDRLQPLELLRHLEQLPLQEEQLLELKHRHLERELLRHLAQPSEPVPPTLLRLLDPWLLGRVEAHLVEWLKPLLALTLSRVVSARLPRSPAPRFRTAARHGAGPTGQPLWGRMGPPGIGPRKKRSIGQVFHRAK